MRRRAVGLFFICSAIVPLAIVSTAWACGSLVSLKASPRTTSPGQTLTVTGANYSNAAPVKIRWDSRRGTELGQAQPVAGRISLQVQVPTNASHGSHLLLSEQIVNGVPKGGTPGRTTVSVNAAGSRWRNNAAPIGAWGPSNPSGPGGSASAVSLDRAGSGSPGLLPTLLGVLASIALLGTGLATVRKASTTNRTLVA